MCPLGPMCNHDIGVLLRLPSSTTTGDADQVLDAMLEAMGDHEFYCGVYSAKGAPHMDGLLMTLADSLAAKKQGLANAQAADMDMSPHEEARQILHRLISSTNWCKRKCFPRDAHLSVGEEDACI